MKGILASIKTGITHPSLLFRPLNRGLNRTSTQNGVHVFDEDWDNLIILDACRYDYFESVVAPHLSGTLLKKESRGSATREWLKENFSSKSLGDTVYVTANGQYLELQDQLDSSIHDAVWVNKQNERGTVEPKYVTDEALRFAEQYPHKRLLVHYVQPHKPYLGPTAESESWNSRGINLVELMAGTDEIDDETLRSAYKETLQYVVPEVVRLVDNLKGLTVISSDHGELLGERYPSMPLKNYGHSIGIHVPELVEIPWFVCSHSERREIISESAKKQKYVAKSDLAEHLKSLGYS